MIVIVSGPGIPCDALCDDVTDELDEMRAVAGVDLVIDGGSESGVDSIARDWAELHEIPHATVPAQWQRYGVLAPQLRNERMVRWADALATALEQDLVLLAFGDHENVLHVVDIAQTHRVRVVKRTLIHSG